MDLKHNPLRRRDFHAEAWADGAEPFFAEVRMDSVFTGTSKAWVVVCAADDNRTQSVIALAFIDNQGLEVDILQEASRTFPADVERCEVLSWARRHILPDTTEAELKLLGFIFTEA